MGRPQRVDVNQITVEWLVRNKPELVVALAAEGSRRAHERMARAYAEALVINHSFISHMRAAGLTFPGMDGVLEQMEIEIQRLAPTVPLLKAETTQVH